MNHHPEPNLGSPSLAGTLPGTLAASLVEHQEFVRRIALRLTGDPSEADDAAQDTWVRALERRPSLSQKLGPWLETSLRGIVRNRRRAAGRRALHERAAARLEIAPTEQLALRQFVVDAVLALDEPFRRTVVMTYQEGLSTAEVAEREGVAAGTVRTRLHRAHAQLRERVADTDDQRSRLAALAVALPPVAGRAGASLGLIAAIAAAPAVVWALSADSVSPSAAEPAPPSVETVAAAPAHVEPELTAPEPAAESLQQDRPGERRALVPDVPVDAAYWNAVRRTRAKLPRYAAAESGTSAALRQRLGTLKLGRPPLTLDANALTAAAAEHDLPLTIAPAALTANSAQLGAEWIVPPAAMPASEWLNLVVLLLPSGMEWEILDGEVHLAPIEDLVAHAQPFDHRIDDLLLDPAVYFEGGVVPLPIYSMVPTPDELLMASHEWMTTLRPDGVEAEAQTDPTALRWRHTPRAHLRVQQSLDQIRLFRQPLPEHGVPGTTLWIDRTDADRSALAALRAAGGIEALLSRPGDTLVAELRELGKRHGLGVLWTEAAREQADSLERLSLDVLHGCVVLRECNEAIADQPCTLWMDLRGAYEGNSLDPVKLSESPELLAFIEEGHKPELEADFLVTYVTRFVAPDTWNEDPRNSVRATGESQLIVHQSPRVLDGIEQAVLHLATYARNE